MGVELFPLNPIDKTVSLDHLNAGPSTKSIKAIREGDRYREGRQVKTNTSWQVMHPVVDAKLDQD